MVFSHGVSREPFIEIKDPNIKNHSRNQGGPFFPCSLIFWWAVLDIIIKLSCGALDGFQCCLTLLQGHQAFANSSHTLRHSKIMKKHGEHALIVNLIYLYLGMCQEGRLWWVWPVFNHSSNSTIKVYSIHMYNIYIEYCNKELTLISNI